MSAVYGMHGLTPLCGLSGANVVSCHCICLQAVLDAASREHNIGGVAAAGAEEPSAGGGEASEAFHLDHALAVLQPVKEGLALSMDMASWARQQVAPLRQQLLTSVSLMGESRAYLEPCGCSHPVL
jgi:hypothetical protein